MAERELKLNSLSRYSKESPLLILEEHGHCEVPAGCGGVVLRWRDPRAGVPLLMRMYVEGECTLLFDGQPPPAARAVAPFGPHVLSFVVSGFDPAYLVLMFSVTDGSSPVLVTAADGTWRHTASEPADDAWLRPGFDDSGWAPLAERPDRRPPDDPQVDHAQHRIDRVANDGAVGLGVAAAAPRVWIRREFTL